ncbi:MAG: glucose-6-phosphate isomerase [Gammaproteobacteria bacterium]|nr:glucose-6-phosphate isomerase [Gammaproteobacteria bacterium]
MEPTKLKNWQALEKKSHNSKGFDMRQAFNKDPERFDRFSFSAAGLFLDFSKNLINSEIFDLLIALSKEAKLDKKIEAMFNGKNVNHTEKRPVLHVAMRNRNNTPIKVNNENIMPQINAVLSKMREFSEAVRSGEYRGVSNKRFTDVINISIGGSHLGPEMVTTALKAYSNSALRCHFITNIDGTDITTTLKNLDPETTLFIIGSKSFTTLEVLTNANSAKKWLTDQLGEEAIAKHFVAATVHPERAKQFGISSNNIFQFWPWVGGRFSVWSSIGLVIALSVGMDNFERLLDGAHAMDQHFRIAPFEHNMPVILALLAIWYHNFFGAENHAIITYNHYLRYLARYLQQIDMESNGKSVYENGAPTETMTGPIIFGDCGTNSQHSFHQLLHQGTHLIPVDFIIPINSLNPIGKHHKMLFANCLGQSAALLNGRKVETCYEKLKEAGVSDDLAKLQAAHKAMSGNRPSNTILLKKLSPESLGAIMALYELKIFTQGVVLGINSFDQWGVELGKALTEDILPYLNKTKDIQTTTAYSHSTKGLIDFYHQYQE